jgi:hypothetical protein
MRGQSPRSSVVVMSASWTERATEIAFVTRALAGAASRRADVRIVTPMPSDWTAGDGAFDVSGIGPGTSADAVGRRSGRPEDWPSPTRARWTEPPGSAIWLLDESSPALTALLGVFGGGARAHVVKPVPGSGAPGASPLPLPLLPGAGAGESLGVYVPVNPLAAAHRHGGLGFTGYLLVLTDRPSTPAVAPPSPAVAWLTARFHDQYVVVVEGGSAAVWKGRALRGVVGVDTRIDLWRLMAHARVVIDALPGDVIARECIESLRFGTPIVVPKRTPGAAHADAGGGLTYSGVPELLEAVERLLHASERERHADDGARYANSRHGDPATFVTDLTRTLGLPA